MTSLTFWAANNLSMGWHELIFEMPMKTLMLWARQDQYISNDKVITLGDKEMIDEMNGGNNGN